ncbi:MAG: glycoside hydrolase family 2 protein [Oscillospiraceae bacterium]|nr:glycoside hydrolase family 2 protein [Oscillospiraceae bacterium]
MRSTISINQGWKFIKTADNVVHAMQQVGEAVSLPHTWNAQDGQDGGNNYHRGACWYIRELEKPVTDGEVYLEVNGAAMTAVIYLNGQKLAVHTGGFSAFRVNLTEHLKAKNTLAISVDNSDNDTVYPQKADFTFYGGLYRNVNLIVVPKKHFELDFCGTPGIKVTPTVDLEHKSAVVTVETWQNAEEVYITVDGQSKTVASVDGHAVAEFEIENVHLWDGLDDPYLYTAKASLTSGDVISTRFGCRQFEIDPQKGFILNGRSYPLRGVSRHQDLKDVGNALTLEHHRQDMAIIRELGANTLRLAHYQHAQEFYDLCDENGIIVWAEIPYITMHMKNGRANTLSQMAELVVQNYNHPSIAVWGLSNEITAASTVNEDLLDNHRLLNDLCHKLDATRPTTMANVFMLEIDSPILEIPDVNSYNLYFGWYVGELEQTDEFFDEYHIKYPDRAIGFSEYGADANPLYQSASPEKGDYTESYQAVYHEHMLSMIEDRPWIWASHVWNLFDFAADGRDEGGKHGENQKGIVTFDRKLKKDAFYLYKSAWSKEPVVHICGSRYVDRTEDVTEIKVYSNFPEVTLYVDGKLFAAQSGERVFKFHVPISGEHSIEAKAGGYSSVIFIRKVAEQNPKYVFVKKQDVVNWFDQDELDPTCYSVSDTMGELRKSPEAGAVVDQLMVKGAASRGDVAESVMNNPALIRMLNRMTLIGMMKQAGEVDPESVKQLNRILQRIKKV